MTVEVSKPARLNFRVSNQALVELKLAAERNQQDLTSFVLGAALEKARREAFFSEVLQLEESSYQKLMKAMEDVLEPNQNLIDFVTQYGSKKTDTPDPNPGPRVSGL